MRNTTNLRAEPAGCLWQIARLSLQAVACCLAGRGEAILGGRTTQQREETSGKGRECAPCP